VDPLAAEPWRHNWAGWLGNSMSGSTVPTAALVWSECQRWHFACRCSFKTTPEEILDFLGWLGPFIDTGDYDRLEFPTFVGTMQYDGEPMPYPLLLMCRDKQLSVADFNSLYDRS
jgi:hypothetical protein